MECGGTRDKDRNFWMDLREWDVMVLSETWVDKKGMGELKRKATKRIYMSGGCN